MLYKMLMTQTSWVWPPFLLLAKYVSWSKLLNFCAPHFPHLYNRDDNNTYLMGLLGALKKLAYVTNIEQIVALSKCYGCVSCCYYMGVICLCIYSCLVLQRNQVSQKLTQYREKTGITSKGERWLFLLFSCSISSAHPPPILTLFPASMILPLPDQARTSLL